MDVNAYWKELDAMYRTPIPKHICVSCGDYLGVEMDTEDPTRCIICAGDRRSHESHREFIRTLPLTVACDCGCGARWDIPTAICGDCDERFPAEDGTHTDCPKRLAAAAAAAATVVSLSVACRLCGDHYDPATDGYKDYCGLNCYTDANRHWRREYD
jgi:hypothetical protein